MADVRVEASRDNAVLLLEQAEKAKESADIVRFSDGWLIVDESLARKAKVKFEKDEEAPDNA